MDAVMTLGERVGALAQHFEFKGFKRDIKGISLTEIPYYFESIQFIAKKVYFIYHLSATGERIRRHLKKQLKTGSL